MRHFAHEIDVGGTALGNIHEVGRVVVGIAEGVVHIKVQKGISGRHLLAAAAGRIGIDTVVGGNRGGSPCRWADIIDDQVAVLHDVVEEQILERRLALVVHLDAPDHVIVHVAVDCLRITVLVGIHISTAFVDNRIGFMQRQGARSRGNRRRHARTGYVGRRHGGAGRFHIPRYR